MKFYNIKHPNDGLVNFSHAVIYGLGRNQGLFFPVNLPEFTSSEINNLLNMDFITRSVEILSVYIGNEISKNKILKCVSSAFAFSPTLSLINSNIGVLELFHGPTLAFKDFGARFMAQILIEINVIKKLPSMVILTATSGDTGAAVAHAFYNMDNIQVVILYPECKIPLLQEKLFSTLGKNIHSIAVDGDFDVCQLLIKQAFDDDILKKKLFLNSANSMNICRLLAQVCYFFEAMAQLPKELRKKNITMSIPSGNFGNLTAGLLAKSLGLPIKRFIAATNINDTVPRFLDSGCWDPRPTVPTLSNAMDVSIPNNWDRIVVLFKNKNWNLSELCYGSVYDSIVCDTIRSMFYDYSYLSEPHAAIAYYLLRKKLQLDEFGVFLATAHPAKFKDVIEKNILGRNIVSILLPDHLYNRFVLPSLSTRMSANFALFREFMLDLQC